MQNGVTIVNAIFCVWAPFVCFVCCLSFVVLALLHPQDVEVVLLNGDNTRIFHTKAKQEGEVTAYCSEELPTLEASLFFVRRLCVMPSVPRGGQGVPSK